MLLSADIEKSFFYDIGATLSASVERVSFSSMRDFSYLTHIDGKEKRRVNRKVKYFLGNNAKASFQWGNS